MSQCLHMEIWININLFKYCSWHLKVSIIWTYLVLKKLNVSFNFAVFALSTFYRISIRVVSMLFIAFWLYIMIGQCGFLILLLVLSRSLITGRSYRPTNMASLTLQTNLSFKQFCLQSSFLSLPQLIDNQAKNVDDGVGLFFVKTQYRASLMKFPSNLRFLGC